MEEEKQNFFKRRVNIFGKSISVMVLALLVLGVTGVTAALLTYYGLITGTVTVTQAIKVDGKTWGSGSESIGDSLTQGTENINLHDLENTGSVSAGVDLETECTFDNGTEVTEGSTTGDYDIDWTESPFNSETYCDGILTRYVEYFDDAGHDCSDYSAPTGDVTVSTWTDLVTEVQDGTPEIVVVSDGTYTGNGVLTITDGDTVVAASYLGASLDGIDIQGDGATVKGFEVIGGWLTQSRLKGIQATVPSVLIECNYIRNLSHGESGKAVQGIHLYDSSDSEVVDNKIENIVHTNGWGAYGIIIQKDSDNVDVHYNTIDTVESTDGWSGAISTTPDSAETDAPVSLSVEYNTIGTVTGSTTYPGVCFYNDYINKGDASDITIQYNNFNGCPVDLENKDSTNTMTGNDNWFGTDGIVLDEADGNITADWETKSDWTLEASEFDKFGILNDIPANMVPGTYEILSGVVPV